MFEAAKFAYGNIRQTARALGMATEASMRFSKGVDCANVGCHEEGLQAGGGAGGR